ncbi:MAG: dehydrogenase, partial [Bacteroidales bacterium]|nr:dehydrogenase [Bacteroidales bacterium]
MNWDKLLSTKRTGEIDAQLKEYDRTQFQRDYDRLIFSSPFRRMQDKTQVFPLPGSVFVHNRLTHSLEVASVGRSLGNNIS